MKQCGPVFFVLTSVGDIGLLLLGEAGLLLVGEILGSFFRPTTAVCLRFSGSASAACCVSAAALWALFCCSSCNRPAGGDKRNADDKTVQHSDTKWQSMSLQSRLGSTKPPFIYGHGALSFTQLHNIQQQAGKNEASAKNPIIEAGYRNNSVHRLQF